MMPLFPHEDADRAREIYERLSKTSASLWQQTGMYKHQRDPFRVLLSSILSARTLGEDTQQATDNLFELAKTPAEMAQLSYEQVLEAVQPVNFPEAKAEYVLDAARYVAENGDEVPRSLDALMNINGVGWKVGLLTLWIAYGEAPEICVDVHVGRIGKRLGLVNPKTQQPQKISKELMTIVPHNLWGVWNPTMVNHGRKICYPVDPACDRCPIADLCPKIGVKTRTK